MARFRHNLPQVQTERIFLSEGGLLTRLLFEKTEFEVPEDNIFLPLAKNPNFPKWLDLHYKEFMDLSLKEHDQFGFILHCMMSARATKDVVYTKFNIAEAEWRLLIKDAVKNLERLRIEYEELLPSCPPIVISGIIVPRGDGYTIESKMTREESANFHRDLIQLFAEETNADFVTAALMKYAEEAIGIVTEASKFNLPIVISFTLGVDGNLPSGQTVKVKTVN